jgi:thiosulfate/3-mercaptopyruvate sulfurtransferase
MKLRAAVAGLALLVLTAASAPRDTMLVSTAWLAEHLNDPGLVILHVGTPASYAQHIPGARHVTLADISVTSEAGGTLEMLSEPELRLRLAGLGIGDRSRIIVAYADSVPQATRVVFTLDAAGLGERTSLLDGGKAAWEREGRPLTIEVPTAHIGSLSPLNMKDVIVDADGVRASAGKPGYAVIDARVPEFFSGAKPGGSAERPHKAGHIPGAKNVPVTTLTDEKMNVQSAANIKAAFDKAGVKPGDKLMVYCHIGQQATAIVFAARTLGYDAVLYDGSFEEWSRKDLPVEK